MNLQWRSSPPTCETEYGRIDFAFAAVRLHMCAKWVAACPTSSIEYWNEGVSIAAIASASACFMFLCAAFCISQLKAKKSIADIASFMIASCTTVEGVRGQVLLTAIVNANLNASILPSDELASNPSYFCAKRDCVEFFSFCIRLFRVKESIAAAVGAMQTPRVYQATDIDLHRFLQTTVVFTLVCFPHAAVSRWVLIAQR